VTSCRLNGESDLAFTAATIRVVYNPRAGGPVQSRSRRTLWAGGPSIEKPTDSVPCANTSTNLSPPVHNVFTNILEKQAQPLDGPPRISACLQCSCFLAEARLTSKPLHRLWTDCRFFNGRCWRTRFFVYGDTGTSPAGREPVRISSWKRIAMPRSFRMIWPLRTGFDSPGSVARL